VIENFDFPAEIVKAAFFWEYDVSLKGRNLPTSPHFCRVQLRIIHDHPLHVVCPGLLVAVFLYILFTYSMPHYYSNITRLLLLIYIHS
jgi:hypothetical protein